MKGWEATAQAAELFSAAWPNYKNSLLSQAVNDLGINRVRLEVKSGIENPVDYFTQWRNGQITESAYNAKRYEQVNDNSNAQVRNEAGFKWASLDSTITNVVIPMQTLATARGEKLWVNVNYVDFGAGVGSFKHKNSPAEYAEFVLATYQHIQSHHGFVPDSWEIILEPDTASASWANTQVAQCIKAAGQRLADAGYTPRFIAPSVTNAGNAVSYLNEIANTQGSMAYMYEFSYHLYSGNNDTNRTDIWNLAALYGKQTAMLEWISADYNTIHADIKTGRTSSWEQFTLAGPISWGADNGDRYYLIDDGNVSSPTISMGSRTKLLRQYFKYIRYGAQRIGATSSGGGLDPLAFINLNGKYVVVVKSTAGGTFSVTGLASGNYGIKYSTSSEYNIDLPDQNSTTTVTTTIPASGVITIYQR